MAENSFSNESLTLHESTLDKAALEIFSACDKFKTDQVPVSTLIDYIRPYVSEHPNQLQSLKSSLDPFNTNPNVTCDVFIKVMTDWSVQVNEMDAGAGDASLCQQMESLILSGPLMQSTPKSSHTRQIERAKDPNILSYGNSANSTLSVSIQKSVLEEQMKDVQQQVQKNAHELHLAKIQLATAEEHNESLQNDLEQVSNALLQEQQLNKQLNLEKEELLRHKDECVTVKKKIQELQKELTVSEKSKIELSNTIHELEKDNTNLFQQLNSLQKKQIDLKRENCDLHKELRIKDEQMTVITHFTDQLKGELEEKDCTITYYNSENELLTSEVSSLRQQISLKWELEGYRSPIKANGDSYLIQMKNFNSPNLVNQLEHPVSPTLDENENSINHVPIDYDIMNFSKNRNTDKTDLRKKVLLKLNSTPIENFALEPSSILPGLRKDDIPNCGTISRGNYTNPPLVPCDKSLQNELYEVLQGNSSCETDQKNAVKLIEKSVQKCTIDTNEIFTNLSEEKVEKACQTLSSQNQFFDLRIEEESGLDNSSCTVRKDSTETKLVLNKLKFILNALNSFFNATESTKCTQYDLISTTEILSNKVNHCLKEMRKYKVSITKLESIQGNYTETITFLESIIRIKFANMYQVVNEYKTEICILKQQCQQINGEWIQNKRQLNEINEQIRKSYQQEIDEIQVKNKGLENSIHQQEGNHQKAIEIVRNDYKTKLDDMYNAQCKLFSEKSGLQNEIVKLKASIYSYENSQQIQFRSVEDYKQYLCGINGTWIQRCEWFSNTLEKYEIDKKRYVTNKELLQKQISELKTKLVDANLNVEGLNDSILHKNYQYNCIVQYFDSIWAIIIMKMGSLRMTILKLPHVFYAEQIPQNEIPTIDGTVFSSETFVTNEKDIATVLDSIDFVTATVNLYIHARENSIGVSTQTLPSTDCNTHLRKNDKVLNTKRRKSLCSKICFYLFLIFFMMFVVVIVLSYVQITCQNVRQPCNYQLDWFTHLLFKYRRLGPPPL